MAVHVLTNSLESMFAHYLGTEKMFAQIIDRRGEGVLLEQECGLRDGWMDGWMDKRDEGMVCMFCDKVIENKKLSNKCLCVILSDIEHTKNLGMDCDIKDWTMLKNKIMEVLNESI